MRSKKRSFQETLKFYHSFVQLNPPYYVLLDSSFVCSIIANRINNILELLESERYFKYPCQLFVSNCVAFHLESEYPNNEHVTAVLKDLKRYPCSHSMSSPLTSSACLFGIASKNQYRRAIGPPRGKHYIRSEDPRVIIASQSHTLLESLTNVVAVPLLYFDNGIINFKKPGNTTLRWVDMMYLKRMEMLQVKLEILWHALEDPDSNSKSGRKGSKDDGANCIGASRSRTVVSSRNADLDHDFSQGKVKRTREKSPDICDFKDLAVTSKKTKLAEFDKFKTLCHETTSNHHELIVSSSENRSSRPLRHMTCTSAATQLTNTSSFEFDNEEF